MYNGIFTVVFIVSAILYPGILVQLFVWGPIAVLVAFWLEHAINESDVTTRRLCAKAKKESGYVGQSQACEFAAFMRRVGLVGVFLPPVTVCAFLYASWLSMHTSHDKAVIDGEIIIEPRTPACPEHSGSCETVRF